LADFNITKSELGALFRREDHPNYMECGDQILRNFLNGLVIHLRGTKENPKNPGEVLSKGKTKTSSSPKKNSILNRDKKRNSTTIFLQLNIKTKKNPDTIRIFKQSLEYF